MSNSSIDCGTSSVIFYLKVRYEYDCKTTYLFPAETITIRIRRHLWSLLTKRSPAHQCWSPAKWSGIEAVQANTLKVVALAKTLETETSSKNTQNFLYSTNNLGEKFSAINPTQFDEAGGEKKPKPRCRKCYIVTLIFKKCHKKMVFALKLSIIYFKWTFDTKMERNYKNYECWILGCLITVTN